VNKNNKTKELNMKQENGCESKSFFNGFTVKKDFEDGQFVWVDGTGFVNGVSADSKVATVVESNEDAVFVSFFDGSEDWFDHKQVKGTV
tara:strand:+ start:289 stop:555 length:267 start_codon:yes stop_codon:yes gene_type:complete